MAINIVANLEANTKEAVRQVNKVNEKVYIVDPTPHSVSSSYKRVKT